MCCYDQCSRLVCDSGATNHMTSSMNFVTQPTIYVGNFIVTFRDGNVLLISHIVQYTINNGIHMHDVLVVPNITKNLLLLETKWVLVHGRCEHKLYLISNKPQAFTTINFSKLQASYEFWHSLLVTFHLLLFLF